MSLKASETFVPDNARQASDPEQGLTPETSSQETILHPKEKSDKQPPIIKDEIDGSAEDDKYEVRLEEEDDPKNLPVWRKWLIVSVICSGALCATCASSMAAFAETGVSRDLHVGSEVAILGVSLFVIGLGIGPLLVGPLSEVHGRSIVYRASYLLFFAFSWAVAFPPHIAVYTIFRFLTGFCSAAFLSVAGGSVSDLFDNTKIATPMAVYTMSPFIGPVLGPIVAGFISQNTNWRWIFRVLIIWTFVQFIMLLLLVPETYAPVLVKNKAARLRKATGDDRYWAPLDRRQHSMLHAMVLSCYVPFKLLFLDPMALLLDLWSALLLGILYLTFQAFPIIFGEKHHFPPEFVGLTFIGMGVGMGLGLAAQPLFNRYRRNVLNVRYKGQPPVEVILIPGMFGAILVPISLYWLAFTTYAHVHWIVPIIASAPFGTGIFFCFTAVFTYTVSAYRPIAASAMAANTFFLYRSFSTGSERDSGPTRELDDGRYESDERARSARPGGFRGVFEGVRRCFSTLSPTLPATTTTMSMLARVPVRQLAARRFAAPVRHIHGEYKHIPFEYSNKTTWATKLTVYLAGGFAIPFVAAYYQLRKSSGSE
ncbi:hypothetical protein NM688_g5793 [Phlebia brevispora]|uniref:Uncharacterized protein n=1 Tax=Phlebia brevispora TaxID=194682 RepID=A0ACC1SPU1_9APHY|nr:hypothetical protein NM688_g5793 [Phlebia brevispora]